MTIRVVLHTDLFDDESTIVHPFRIWILETGDPVQKRCFDESLRPQLNAYEMWRRKQSFECSLHLYQTHFYGCHTPIDITGHESFFAKYPEWTFTSNLWERRHQAFIEQMSNEPMVLLGCNTLIPLELDITGALDQCKQGEVDLYSFQRTNADSDCPADQLQLTGLWIISPRLQKVFASLDRTCFVEDNRNDLFLANIAKHLDWCKIKVEMLDTEVVGNQYEYANKKPFVADHWKTVETIENPYIRWNFEDFDQWRKKFTWKLAKTMRWCPHEYVMPNSHGITMMDLYLPCDYIWRNVVVDLWRKQAMPALFIGSDKYWAHCYALIVNHTSKELEQRIFAEDGKDEFGRKIKPSV